MSADHDQPQDPTGGRNERQRARGTVPINGSALKKLRIARGLKQEVLAKKADINPRTLQRAEAGEAIEQKFAEKIAAALGVPLFDIRQDAPPLPKAPAAPPPPEEEPIILAFPLDCGPLDEAARTRIAGMVADELRKNEYAKHRILLVKIMPGSIRIVLQVNKEDADRIREAFEKGELAYLGVSSVTLPSRQPPSHWRHWLAAFGYLSILSAVLALVPVITVPACATGLALSAVGLFFAYRRRTNFIVPAVGALLNAALLVYALYGAFTPRRQADGDTRPEPSGQPTQPAPAKLKETGRATQADGATPKGDTGKKPPNALDEQVKKAIETVNAADLKYNEMSVPIGEDVIRSLVTWGDVSRLTPKDYKTTAKLVSRQLTGLSANANCGGNTGYMENRGGYSIFAANGRGQGVGFVEHNKRRLIVYVPYDSNGLGTPSLIKADDKEDGTHYGTDGIGYVLVKIE